MPASIARRAIPSSCHRRAATHWRCGHGLAYTAAVSLSPPQAAVIGGGPAGLIAAETLAVQGMSVTVFDQMPSVGRKFLMAGKGGLNLTHSESLGELLGRYGAAGGWLEHAVTAAPPQALIDWCHALGQPTFTGSSGRVFPAAMKASPLLRAWLRRLTELGVRFRARHRWSGWRRPGELGFDTPAGPVAFQPDVTILALGGASWPRLGSDGAWAAYVQDTAPFRSANCGFEVAWSDHFAARFAGHPLKRIAITHQGRTVRGEAMITATGIEGGAVYALSAGIRDAIEAGGSATIHLDLRPDIDAATLIRRLGSPRGSETLSNLLRKRAGLPPAPIGLLREAMLRGAERAALPLLVKSLPLLLNAPSPIGRAISTAGGVRQSAVDERYMLIGRPGTFVAGEMLDWEAPTGGYLLQACFSTGIAAARGALAWLADAAIFRPEQ
jgi:uncharacterized flavoprotein (TIGR03862 family)